MCVCVTRVYIYAETFERFPVLRKNDPRGRRRRMARFPFARFPLFLFFCELIETTGQAVRMSSIFFYF